MNEEKQSPGEEAAAPDSTVEPASGEMTEDELSEAVGGAGSAEESGSESSGEQPARGWWTDPNA